MRFQHTARKFGWCILATFAWNVCASEHPVPKVVTTLKPIHSLVDSVLGDVGSATLLIKGVETPHTYQMRPSDAVALQEADLVVWIGGNLEKFLARSITNLSEDARVLTLHRLPEVRLLPYRLGGIRVEDLGNLAYTNISLADAEPHKLDMHIWLDPVNMRAATQETAKLLAEIDPSRVDIYQKNADSTIARITSTEGAIRNQLKDARTQPFLVFHDAYQYFARAFELQLIGAITVDPSRAPGAKRLTELRQVINKGDIRCVFVEPQFKPDIVDSIVADTSATAHPIDALGLQFDPGPNAWFETIEALGTSLANCLIDD